MANITLGAGTIDQTRQILTVAIGGATGALTLTTPNITVTVNSVSAPTGTITTTGSGATAKLVIPLTSVATIGQAIVVTATSSGIVDASEDTLSNGTTTVTDTVNILALGAGTIDQTRKILSIAVTGATGALTVGGAPAISVTVGGNPAAIGTVTSTGTGATAKLLMTLATIAPVGSAIIVTALASGVVDTLGCKIANGATTITDAQSAAQTVVQAAVQAGFVNDGFHQLFSNGLFGKVVVVSAGKYTVYAMDNVTPLADVYGSTDTAGNISIDHIDRR